MTIPNALSRHLVVFIALFGLALGLASGCVTPSGDVVRVTTVDKKGSAGLGDEEKAKLEEIRKERGKGTLDPGLSAVLEETPHLSVSEYLAENPDAGKSGQDYRVGGYDVLNITVYEEEDLSREAVRVSADGYISFPLIGRVHVDGMNTSEIEELISTKLAEGQYLLDAHVSVMVTEYKSKRFLVLGSVQAPGSYPLEAQERFLDALSKAEGLAGEEFGKSAVIVRTKNPDTARESKVVLKINLGDLLKGRDPRSNIFLRDRDIIFIPSAEHFYVMGEVKSPGSYTIPEKEITLVEAISMAGGFTPIAARNRTRIVRIESGREKIIEVKVDAITDAGKKIQDVLIQPNDVIVVPESFF
jgi:polysaccharide export outer membrane protein